MFEPSDKGAFFAPFSQGRLTRAGALRQISEWERELSWYDSQLFR